MRRNPNRSNWTAVLLVLLLLAPIPHPSNGFRIWHPVDRQFAANELPHGSASAPAHVPVLLKQRGESVDARASMHDAATPAVALGLTVPDGSSTCAGLAGAAGPTAEGAGANRGRAPPLPSSL